MEVQLAAPHYLGVVCGGGVFVYLPVLTGHRGLADAEIFTNLGKVALGDTFSIEVMGEVFSYRVFDIKVVDPDATEEIRAEKGKDLATLITCTPLGINTHRILLTGERIDPTPQADIDAAGEAPNVPGFPGWALAYLATIIPVTLWYRRTGYPRERKRVLDKRAK